MDSKQAGASAGQEPGLAPGLPAARPAPAGAGHGPRQRREPDPGPAGRRPRGLAPGLLAARDRLLALARLRPVVADALLAAVILALSLPPFTSLPKSSQALPVALIVAAVCPLAWRRRAPFAVLMVITVPAAAQVFTGQQVTDFLAFLVAFYTVAVYSPARRVLIATAVVCAGTVLAVLKMEFRAGHAVLVWALASGMLAVAGLLGYYVRTTRQERETARAERAEQTEREREQQTQLAASAERARIAREMHDIIAHNLAVMIALADGAAYTAAADSEQAISLMSQVSATGRTALTEMRRLLGVLRQPASAGHAPQPGLADLDDLLATVRSAGLPAEVTTAGQPFPLPPSAELAVYRIIGEALTNTLKHAPGASARVHLAYRPGAITLEIADDGRPGHDAAAGHQGTAPLDAPAASTVAASAGHGISGIRERAAVFGGKVSAGPLPGGGWRVHAVLRIDQATEVL